MLIETLISNTYLDMDVKIGLLREPQIHEKPLTLPCYRQLEMNILKTTLQKIAIEVEEPRSI